MEYYSNLKSLCRHSPQNLHFVDISWLIQFIFSHAQVLAIAYGNFIDGPLDQAFGLDFGKYRFQSKFPLN